MAGTRADSPYPFADTAVPGARVTLHDLLVAEALGRPRCATRTPELALPDELADRLAR